MKIESIGTFSTKRGIGPESLVGICIERSPDMIIGLFGILKAGLMSHWTQVILKTA